MKVLAVDYGEKRIGLAIGDRETNLALPYGVLRAASAEIILEKLDKIINEEEIDTLVIGEPLAAGGTVSQQTKVTREFADFLKKNLTVKVLLFDERFTSQRADAAMSSQIKSRSRDELAAMFLLQDYLDSSSGT